VLRDRPLPNGRGRNSKTDYDLYETPEVLVTDLRLSSAQKLARLEVWDEDLKAGLRASRTCIPTQTRLQGSS
jgi:hypothetical protein